MPDSQTWSIVVHGGCRLIPVHEAGAFRAGLEVAVRQAVRHLVAGGNALDAAEAAVVALEDDPTFNAGTGAVPRSDGSVELDAAIMDGDTLEIGGVCVARDVRNPIRLARENLRRREILLAGLRGEHPAPTSAAAANSPGCDTVGAVVRDGMGRMAAAVSTGGLRGARPGRVGDSPLPGCGFYVDSRIGGVVATGVGESIARTLLSGRAVWEMEREAPPQAALEQALARLAQVGGEAGLIAVSARGEIAFAHRGDQLAVGWARGADGAVEVRITEEDKRG